MNKIIKCSYYEAVNLCEAYVPIAFLTLIPTIISTPETIFEAVAAYGVNLFFVSLLFVYGIFRAKNKYFTYSINNKKLSEKVIYKGGVLEKRRSEFQENSVKSMVIEKNIIPFLFCSEKVILSTGSRSGKNGNFSMFILKKHENQIISCFFGEKNTFKTVHKANLLKIFFMALSSSNAFAGVLIFIPFLNKTGELFGEKYKDLLLSSLDFSPHIQQTGLPPFASAIAGLLLTGLIFSVITVILHYGFLKIQKSTQNDSILIKRGVIQKNIFITSTKRIIAYQIKNSLLMTLLHRCNLKIYACGQHREKGNKRVIVPFLSAKSGEEFLEINLSQGNHSFFAKPPMFSQKAYLYLPLLLIASLWTICIFALFSGFDFSAFYPLIVFVFLLLFVFFTVRIFAHKKPLFMQTTKKSCFLFTNASALQKPLCPFQKHRE